MRSASNPTIEVEVSRIGNASVTVRVPEDSTMADVLAAANITLATGEKLFVNGRDEGTLESIMDDGDSVQVIGRKEGGNN